MERNGKKGLLGENAMNWWLCEHITRRKSGPQKCVGSREVQSNSPPYVTLPSPSLPLPRTHRTLPIHHPLPSWRRLCLSRAALEPLPCSPPTQWSPCLPSPVSLPAPSSFTLQSPSHSLLPSPSPTRMPLTSHSPARLISLLLPHLSFCQVPSLTTPFCVHRSHTCCLVGLR